MSEEVKAFKNEWDLFGFARDVIQEYRDEVKGRVWTVRVRKGHDVVRLDRLTLPEAEFLGNKISYRDPEVEVEVVETKELEKREKDGPEKKTSKKGKKGGKKET